MVNDDLSDEEVKKQVYEFKAKGFYSVVFRTYNGLISDYPGPLFKSKVRAAVDAARECAHLLPKLCDSYTALYNEARGIMPAEVISATALSDDAKARLIARLEEITKKKIVLKERTDASIMGGLIVRYGANQLDGSLRSRLASIEKSLKSTVV